MAGMSKGKASRQEEGGEGRKFLPVRSLFSAHLLQGEKLPIVSSARFRHNFLTLSFPKMLFPASSQFDVQGRV